MIASEIIEHLKNINIDDLKKLTDLVTTSSQVILIGNGGSNSIASHIAVDYMKFLKKKSFAFSDPSMLTAFMNDYSIEDSYAKYIDCIKQDDALVILISSSGNSINIYNSAKYCYQNNINFIILTGFNYNNKVRQAFKDYAKLDYWIDSKSYGVVECVHQIFLHSIIEN